MHVLADGAQIDACHLPLYGLSFVLEYSVLGLLGCSESKNFLSWLNPRHSCVHVLAFQNSCLLLVLPSCGVPHSLFETLRVVVSLAAILVRGHDL